jgi:hypothetical protein
VKERKARPRGRGSFLIVVAVAAWLALLWALLRPSGGLPGSYYARAADGREVLVHRRIDPGIVFAVPRRIDTAYLFHWDVEKWGIPEERPPYLIRWSGVLLVPAGGAYGFSVDARGEAALGIDSMPLALRPDAVTVRNLTAGLHPIALEYRSEEGEARVILRWQPPGGTLQPIPVANLGADGAAIESRRARRVAGWLLLAAGAATALFLWGRARRAAAAGDAAGGAGVDSPGAPSNRARLALTMILALAALLRFHDYALAPFHDGTAEEYQHAWQGWHLLHGGAPVSWSSFAGIYPRTQVQDLRWFGNGYALVRPYFDHPPLLSILVGLAGTLSGATHFLECALPEMRLVPIVLSLSGVLLLYRLALVYGLAERSALLAALVYAVLPIVVLSHRVATAGNLLAPLLMGAVLLAERHARSGRVRDAGLAGLMCGLSIWTEAAGVAVALTAVVLLLSRRRCRGAVVVLLVTTGFGVLQIAYASAYGLDIFLAVSRVQATSQWAGLEGFLDLLDGRVVAGTFGRGWYLWLLLCAGAAAFRKERALLVPLAIYAGLLVLAADFRALSGWSVIPLYPFLCLAAGIYLEQMIEASDLYRVFPFGVTALLSGVTLVLPPAFAQSKGAVAAFALAGVAPFIARLAHESPLTARVARASTWIILALLLLTSLAAIGGFPEIDPAGRAGW